MQGVRVLRQRRRRLAPPLADDAQPSPLSLNVAKPERDDVPVRRPTPRSATATALIDDLSFATRKGRHRHTLPAYTHPHVLVINEVGSLGHGPDAANVLFQGRKAEA